MDIESQQSVVGSNGSALPDPEVEPKAKRRRFSAAYKARILEEIDRSPGETGAILRREGLYSSHLTSWRKQRRAGTLKALGKKRGPKGKSEEQRELEQLRRENARLQRELEKSQIVIDAQKSSPRSSGWICRSCPSWGSRKSDGSRHRDRRPGGHGLRLRRPGRAA